MKDQNYANHSRYVPGFHFLLGSLLLLGTITSIVNAFLQISAHDNGLGSVLIVVLFICGILLFWFVRRFSVAVQDRAIRAEESLRYYILTHKAIDVRLTKGQIIALRFAPDDEFLVLADRAVRENLSPVEIKKSIKNWRADNDRA
jgi:biopolymer transport protein ExbB/TolQ